jgi:hypothetical protein
MLFDRRAGPISEPLTGRHWDQKTVLREFARRVTYFRDQGIRPLDRVFVHHGNNLEFFVDLLAIFRGRDAGAGRSAKILHLERQSGRRARRKGRRSGHADAGNADRGARRQPLPP